MEQHLELIRNITTLKWYIIYLDENNNLASGKALGSKLFRKKELPKLSNCLYYNSHNGHWFANYVWITEGLEVVLFPVIEYDVYLLSKKITTEILMGLGTRIVSNKIIR